MSYRYLPLIAALTLPLSAHAAEPAKTYSFTRQADAAVFDPARGYGFEGTHGLTVNRGVQSSEPFFFSTAVAPEGNYKVTITFGGPKASKTTVKAELRRLALEGVSVPAGGSVTRSFIVNSRTPAIVGGGAVRLKGAREAQQEAVNWDKRITLEFNGLNPAIRSITVTPVDVPTIYILGDSTSTDQMAEPYASWGQMLTGLMEPTVGVSNHGQSGESVAAANAAGRFNKIINQIKPGDVFITQFGHNDMKSTSPNAPMQYRDGLIAWAKAVQAKGATAIIVTPVNRHTFKNGKVEDSFNGYTELAREAARTSGAKLIDLNLASKAMYEALGETGSLELFKHNPDGTARDATHHSNYGAYELARVIAQGLRDLDLPVGKMVRKDLPRYDPAKPGLIANFKIPSSPNYTDQRPLGD